MGRWKTGRLFGPLGSWPTAGRRVAWPLAPRAQTAMGDGQLAGRQAASRGSSSSSDRDRRAWP
eukprot:711003-Alexandrium_andersonii.AAC.1